LQKSVAKSVLLENAIDSRMRIKTTTYRDVQQKPCQFYWHGLLHITINCLCSPTLYLRLAAEATSAAAPSGFAPEPRTTTIIKRFVAIS
ncbi:MAG: hypothetical protein ACK5Y6_09295, partial [Pseudomonadota bacterium]